MKKLKKSLPLVLAFVSLVLGASVFLLMLAPAVTITGTTIIGSQGSSFTIYDTFSAENKVALNIAIVVVLACGVFLALALFAALVLVKRNKKNKTIFAGVSFLTALLLIAVGVMFFFVANAYKGAQVDLGSLAKVTVNLGIGAVLSGIVAILSGLTALYNSLKLTK